MGINDLMERQIHRVKLHNPRRNAIYPSDEDQGQRPKHERSGDSGTGESRTFKTNQRG
jgi:hypothetical protein